MGVNANNGNLCYAKVRPYAFVRHGMTHSDNKASDERHTAILLTKRDTIDGVKIEKICRFFVAGYCSP